MRSEKEKVKTEAVPPTSPLPVQEEPAAPVVEVLKKEVNVATPTVMLPRDESTPVMVSSPFQPAKNIRKRLKLMLWGDSGVGKTILSLQFPRIAVIDTELGTVSYSDKYPFSVKHTSDFDEILGIVDYLTTNKHNYATLVIDPITVIWESIQKKWSDIFLIRNRGGKGFKHEFYDMQAKDWQAIKSNFKELIRKLNKLDMNVIVTAGEKVKYREGSMLVPSGETFDAEKTLHRSFDTVVRIYFAEDGKRRMAHCSKDRNQKISDEEFELDSQSYGYNVFLRAFGKDYLDRDSVPIRFATDEQKNKLKILFIDLHFPIDSINKRLTAYDAETIDDLTFENAEIIINKLETFKKEKKEK